LDDSLARRTPRYSIVVDVEATDIQSEAQIRGRTKQLSLLGCGFDAPMLFRKGTNVRIELSHRGAAVIALARVIYASQQLGMGLAFTSVDSECERILELWIAEFMSISI
jgi:PilZ domain